MSIYPYPILGGLYFLHCDLQMVNEVFNGLLLGILCCIQNIPENNGSAF